MKNLQDKLITIGSVVLSILIAFAIGNYISVNVLHTPPYNDTLLLIFMIVWGIILTLIFGFPPERKVRKS
jgi:uncharacterized protein YneF (UPF0154 family)